MKHFEPRELDFISAKLRILIEEGSATRDKKGVILDYEQLSIILDHTILTESLISELRCRLLEHDLIIVNLGAQFWVLEGEEVLKYERASIDIFVKVMRQKIVLF